MRTSPTTVFCALLATALAGTARSQTPPAAATAQNVIVFVGDGLGPATATAARLMRYKDDGSLSMDTMPMLARVRTFAVDAQTADGASSTSALMTGVKVRNGVVAMTAQTRSLGYAPGRDPIRNVPLAENRCPATDNGGAAPTLLELAIAAGRATGIVTTGRLTGPAAAAAYAHICHGDAQYDVARQAVPGGAGSNEALGRGIDVLLGGGSGFWRPFDAARRPRGRPDARELVGELQTQGYSFVTDLTALNAVAAGPGTKLIGLFDFADTDGTQLAPMSYELDRDPKREPSLAEMTARAIDILSRGNRGYVLVVQSGRIASAQQAGSARRALTDTIAFDDAIRVALEHVDLNRTLIVATGNHDTTMTFFGGGRRGSDVLGLHLNPVTGKPDVDGGGATYGSIVYGTGPNRPDRRVSLDTPTVVGRDYVGEAAIRLAVGSNGGSDVVLHAAGAGSSAFHGTLDNTRVFTLVQRAAGL